MNTITSITEPINNPKLLSETSMRQHTEAVRSIQLDIIKQVKCYDDSTGEVQECYKKIILDKIWKLRTIVAKFYYLCSSATDELEMLVGEPRAYRTMTEENLRYLEPSYISSVRSESVPSVQHQ